MKYLSVCSGIEAASVAWKPLGWECVGVAEIEKFPSAVLAHHYPNVPNLGDLTKYQEWPRDLAPDLIVGGTPCQSFSVAGLRAGLADPRGNLALIFLGLVDRYRPRYVVWENVPGVRSSGKGRDFGAFLGALGELGYGWAYRSLDAQYFGLAQRRERVFVVGCLGDWRPSAAVLLEPEGLRGDSAPRRPSREDLATTLASRTRSGSGHGPDTEAPVISLPTKASYAVRTAQTGANGIGVSADLSHTIDQANGQAVAYTSDLAPGSMAVRRLTPRECERLQGFPDDYTLVPYGGRMMADGQRYKMLGNSMAVPVMNWIGCRVGAVQAMTTNHVQRKAA